MFLSTEKYERGKSKATASESATIRLGQRERARLLHLQHATQHSLNGVVGRRRLKSSGWCSTVRWEGLSCFPSQGEIRKQSIILHKVRKISAWDCYRTLLWFLLVVRRVSLLKHTILQILYCRFRRF